MAEKKFNGSEPIAGWERSRHQLQFLDTAELELPNRDRLDRTQVLIAAVEQAQQASRLRTAVEYGIWLATPIVLGLCFGWPAAALGIPLGGVFFFLTVSWNERRARQVVRELESHLAQRKGFRSE